MWTPRFWKDAVERALKTFAQTLIALLGVGGFGIIDAPWFSSLSVAGLAALLSVLSSVASATVGEQGTASLVPPSATAAPATTS
jgi:hypothetical protein